MAKLFAILMSIMMIACFMPTMAFAAGSFTVEISLGTGMERPDEGNNGDLSQSNVGDDNEITPITINATTDYYFQTDYTGAEDLKGLTVTVAKGGRSITISGTPNAAGTITLADASKKTKEDTPSVGFTATGYNTGKLTGVKAGLTYQIGEENIVEIKSTDDVPLNDLTPPCTIKVVRKATGESKQDSDPQEIKVTRATKPTDLEKTEPTTIDGKGTIATTTDHEYSMDAAEPKNYQACTANMELDPGTTYYIRVKASGQVLASESQDYSVAAFVPGKEPTPNASFEAKGADNGILSKVESGMQYSLNGTDWVAIKNNTVNIERGVTTAGIKVQKPGDGKTTTDSAIQAIPVEQKEAPTADQVKATNCTAAGDDGKLTGVTADMEYQKKDAKAWTPGNPDGTINNLTAGTYYVRTKAAGAALASKSLSFEIKGYPTATAAAPDVIKGITTVELEAKDITITLASATLNGVKEGDPVSAWFDTLPEGLKATVKEVKNNTEVTITISGTPTKEGKATAKITIPKDKLVDGKEGGLPVANDVTFSIAKYYHVVTGGGGGGAAAKPTQPTTPEQKPATAAGKTAANTAITTAAAANKYDKAEQAEVDQIVKDAEAKIKEAKTEDEVKAIQKDAETKLDKILTTGRKSNHCFPRRGQQARLRYKIQENHQEEW